MTRKQDEPTMSASLGRKFDELRSKYVNTPEQIERYGRTVRTIVLTRNLLMTIDSESQRAGLCKAELARRIGVDPSLVRRLFSGKTSNPRLKVVLDMLSALKIDVELRSPQEPRASTAATTPNLRRDVGVVLPSNPV